MILTIIILLIVIVVFQIYIIFRKFKQKGISKEQQSFLTLLENSKDVVYYYEVSKMKFKYISSSIEKFLGKGVIEEAIQNPYAPFERVHPDDYDALCKKTKGVIDFSQTLIQRWMDTSGNYRWFEEYATPIYQNGKLVAVQGIMRNIDEKIKLQQELEFRINHDGLTDTYNRFYFEKKFEELNTRLNMPVAIVICDLDELKFVNDNFGHKSGDELIKQFAELLNQFSSESIIVARIGGDEFILIITDKSENQVKQLVSEIHNEVAHFNSNHLEVTLKMSIGYSYAPYSVGQMDSLFSQADKNMYTDKMSKKMFADNFC